ncbi:MAG: peptide deformylase [Candidatus Moranbacteria bacterium RIFOXYB1_FULL_43_19]|nr:MAG: peptide deformylase [Candidatus Moranbacteria bacterium RIFOXYA1_FULL_44_7]OGI27782.1 MAG: peptide deformylase [Candidatus Moranbacteria bacterium RIFOXYB1_FULL_43_19]OGI33991.1 MAG: peptide deformylase [Candidatus Moranbacteria bacterium RIFOXYC1_FULL_44_13]OGI37704.1 MAG: peptide deformylase [Candidatus Moranbacteria bacterium RIFOXYD1_FULL_44_12]
MLKVLKYPDDFLRKKAREVEDFKNPDLPRLVSDMVKTMEAEKGIGLAAPQVGSDLRICVVRVDDTVHTLINPKIKSSSRKKEIFEEGCLSFPGKFFPVERPIKVKIKARDLSGEKIKIKANGLLARVLQHEIDHLDGILVIDRAIK